MTDDPDWKARAEKAEAQLAGMWEAADRLTYATWAVLCEYGSAGVPMIQRMAGACDAMRPHLADTQPATEAYLNEQRAKALEDASDYFADEGGPRTDPWESDWALGGREKAESVVKRLRERAAKIRLG
jgi:ABC-type sugar transport system substrate-binding protein